ncbi:DUF3164 family protein [Vibrio parahaemolyticus]|uniref:DUF3164 family protein n=1 Tax=Vibrio parahaemolyticus TaxID=670 RepID=UPI0004DF51F0|nr:DUF3164 family protein [Vibrio parahaemolyticus]MBD6947925.1 DUF3164 family protein [Vibrio parahaemolyticus]MBD6959655.1 DUF3164 family protein [Vibrio parahaemolyticus]MBD6977544.1 DUF3164 family protein [Vibrio parahaemolyticus]MBD6990477.1 DUF3164 family protein [Vibrio parahaemolyticus]WOZ60678.1 DUF3164 family protein [Vibrio parahaemolyticus]
MTTETKQATRPEAPEGFVYDASGNLISKANISAIDLRKDAFTASMVEQVKDQQKRLAQFKENLVKAFETFRTELLEQYDAKLHTRGSGDNVTIYSFDGRYKMSYKTPKLKALGPEFEASRELAREWFHKNKDNAPHDLLLPAQEFYTGEMTLNKALKFIGWKVQDPILVKAQAAAKDSMIVIGKKSYFNFYERDEEGEYQAVHLNFAKL